MSIKKTFSLLLLSLTIAIVTAQTDIIGVWKMTEMTFYGEKTQVNMHVDINENGKLYISGRQLGTWKYNEADKSITAQSDMQLDMLNGVNAIKTISDTELILVNVEHGQTSFQRKSLPANKEYENKYVGEYILVKAIQNGQEDNTPNVIFHLNKNGLLYVMEMVMGNWSYQKPENTLILNIKGFDEVFNITTNASKELVLNSENQKLFLEKIDRESILQNNEKSGLIGAWKAEIQDETRITTYLTFEAPDIITILEKQEGMESTYSGTWIYNKAEKELYLIGVTHSLIGKNHISISDDNTLSIRQNGQVTSYKKLNQSDTKIERLTFTDNDFYNENGDYKYYDDQQKLPWFQLPIYGIQNTYAGIEKVVYTYKTLVEQTQTFETQTLEAQANVSFEGDAPSISFDYIFNGYDRNNVPDDYELKVISLDSYNDLFPYEDCTYRVAGSEEISTPAGSFQCTVIEAIGSFDERIKLWMIDDLPGIYAKIVKDKPGDFGYYHIYELDAIENSKN